MLRARAPRARATACLEEQTRDRGAAPRAPPAAAPCHLSFKPQCPFGSARTVCRKPRETRIAARNRLSEALRGRLAVPGSGELIVHGYALAVLVADAEVVLSSSVTLHRRLGIPLDGELGVLRDALAVLVAGPEDCLGGDEALGRRLGIPLDSEPDVL